MLGTSDSNCGLGGLGVGVEYELVERAIPLVMIVTDLMNTHRRYTRACDVTYSTEHHALISTKWSLHLASGGVVDCKEWLVVGSLGTWPGKHRRIVNIALSL